MVNTWQAAEARHRFSEIVNAAVEGQAQFVKRRDGKEVVVVSRDSFEKTRPTLKTWLLTEGFAEDGEDAFDNAMREGSTRSQPRFWSTKGVRQTAMATKPDVRSGYPTLSAICAESARIRSSNNGSWRQGGENLTMTDVSVMEIQRGIERIPRARTGALREALEAWLDGFLAVG